MSSDDIHPRAEPAVRHAGTGYVSSHFCDGCAKTSLSQAGWTHPRIFAGSASRWNFCAACSAKAGRASE